MLSGSDQEEIHYKYHLTVIHGKSEYSYKGPVISLMRSAAEVSLKDLMEPDPVPSRVKQQLSYRDGPKFSALMT